MIGRLNEEGQLSIDLLAGFTIFMLGLIMAVAMVPGLLIGLQRTTAIDYDAVAYRTGAILTEDPGWPVFPPWELQNAKDGVDRLGLAVSKDSPNVLSPTKIAKFNDSTLFPLYPEDYRERIIFGDYPYRFNITLSSNIAKTIFSVGDSVPESSGFGYIRRAVKIKEYCYVTVNLSENYAAHYNVSSYNLAPANQTFTFRLNLTELVDKSINPAYQFDPRIEPIDITMTHFEAKLNNSQYYFNNTPQYPLDFPFVANFTNWTEQDLTPPDNATLSRIRFYKNQNPSSLPFDYDTKDPSKYIFMIKNATGGWESHNLTPNVPVFNDTWLYLLPGTLPVDESTILDITFTFHDVFNETVSTALPRTLINDTHIINYTTITQPPLRSGWLEVAIW